MYKNFRDGFFWSAVGQYGRIISLFIINMFLSRLLTPKEYGQVAMITIFITFFQLMTEAGLGPAIIQQKHFRDKDHSNLFTISILFSIGFACLFGIFGFAIAYYYNDADYVRFSWMLSIVVLFSGMQIVPNAVLLKKQLFKTVNLINLLVTIVSGIVCVFFAIEGFGVYTLIFNSILTAILTFLLITIVSGVVPTKKIDLNPLKKVWSFSKNQFGFNFINYFSRNSDSLLIGKFMSSEALGNYNKSYQLLMYPVTIFGGVVTPILQPVLSNYQDDPKIVREVYFKIIKVLAILTIPFSVFLILSAKQIILIMFGNQWHAAIKPFSILSSTVWIQVITSTAGAIFQARNKTKELFLTGTLSAIILVTAIIIGVTLGTIQTVAICLSIAFWGNFIQSYWFLTHKVLDSNMFQLLKLFVNPTFLGVIMFVTFALYNYLADNFFSSIFIDLLVRIILFTVVFIIGVLSCGEYNTLVNLIIKKHSGN